MARWKAHCWLPISDNWTSFASSHGWGTIKRVHLSKFTPLLQKMSCQAGKCM